MKDIVWDFVVGVVIIAIVFTLVRPGSPAGQAITDVTNAVAGMIGTATNYQAGTSGNSNGTTA